VYRTRLQASTEEAVAHRDKLSKALARLESAEETSLDLAAKLNAADRGLAVVRRGADACRRRVDSSITRQQVLVLGAMERLGDMEARISASVGRVKLAAEVVAQKEIELRNAKVRFMRRGEGAERGVEKEEN